MTEDKAESPTQAYGYLSKQVLELEAENQKLRAALLRMTELPSINSDVESILEDEHELREFFEYCRTLLK